MANVIISIPTVLRTYTHNKKRVEVDAESVNKALNELVSMYTNLKNHLYEDNELRNFVNIYLNDEDIRYLEEGKETMIQEGDQIAIIPSIAGGVI